MEGADPEGGTVEMVQLLRLQKYNTSKNFRNLYDN